MATDIATHRARLLATRQEVETFGRTMDGMVFGYIGADAVVSLVPVVGDIFCGLMILWLVAKAGQVRMSLGERFIIIGLGTIDTAIGMMPVIGDVADAFFRAHGWSAKRVEAHIDMQLAQIEAAGELPEGHPQLTHLRDALFRGGKTQQDVWVRLGLIVAGCLAVLGYCSYQEQLRHERILACEERGGWFCSMRN
jgi:hypothetical protein